jgi:hypothetical protein
MKKNQLDKQGNQDGYWSSTFFLTQSTFKGHYKSGVAVNYWEWVCYNETNTDILKQFYII